MADLIDRDALLKDLRSECPESEVCISGEACIDCIVKRQPAINRWIPVEDALPDDIKPVLITWANNSPVMSCHENDKGKPFTGAAHYCNGKWYWYSQFSEDILGEYGEYQDTVDVDVLAWMPMPDAYKPPESGTHDDDRKASEAWCENCDHIEMCKWYPTCGCEFRQIGGKPAGRAEPPESEATQNDR